MQGGLGSLWHMPGRLWEIVDICVYILLRKTWQPGTDPRAPKVVPYQEVSRLIPGGDLAGSQAPRSPPPLASPLHMLLGLPTGSRQIQVASLGKLREENWINHFVPLLIKTKNQQWKWNLGDYTEGVIDGLGCLCMICPAKWRTALRFLTTFQAVVISDFSHSLGRLGLQGSLKS